MDIQFICNRTYLLTRSVSFVLVVLDFVRRFGNGKRELSIFINIQLYLYGPGSSVCPFVRPYVPPVLKVQYLKPFLAHLSQRLKWAIVIAHRPSSVRPSSVRRKLSHFRLLLWNRVFRADRKNKMAALASDWLRHFRLLLWNRCAEFNETWQEARSQHPLPSLCFSGRSEKQDGRPGLWLTETFSTSPPKPLNGIQRNLTGSKISTSSTKFVFFGPIRKTRWPPWSLIGWDIFNFSSETAERNSTKLDRKQDLKALYQVCVFRADRKNKMAALASGWLRHFRLLLWNRWMEFNETWQEARSQSPLPSLCFSGRSEKQDCRPGLWLAETFSTSPLKLLNGIQRNLTASKISKPSTKFVFFGPIGKTRWPPWPLIGWDIFDFSSETAEPNSTKLDRKQDLNALYQVCVFRADRKIKNGRPGLWLAETYFVFSSETAEPNSAKLDRKQDLNVLYQVCVFRAEK